MGRAWLCSALQCYENCLERGPLGAPGRRRSSAPGEEPRHLHRSAFTSPSSGPVRSFSARLGPPTGAQSPRQGEQGLGDCCGSFQKLLCSSTFCPPSSTGLTPPSSLRPTHWDPSLLMPPRPGADGSGWTLAPPGDARMAELQREKLAGAAAAAKPSALAGVAKGGAG